MIKFPLTVGCDFRSKKSRALLVCSGKDYLTSNSIFYCPARCRFPGGGEAERERVRAEDAYSTPHLLHYEKFKMIFFLILR